jgi:type IV pilus assembly protein PilB
VDRFRWDPMPDPDFRAIPAHVVGAVPAALAREENVMPLAMSDGVLTVAVESPFDFDLIEKLQFILGTCGRSIEPVAAPADAIRAAVARYYGEATA